jgi:hypothetical protein
MSSLRLTNSIVIMLLIVQQVGAAPATQPSLADQAAVLVKQLGSNSYQERQKAISIASHLPADALPLFQAAAKRADISEDLRDNLQIVVDALQYAYSRQMRYQIAVDFYRSHFLSEYDLVGRKDPSWNAPVHDLLEATARQFVDDLCDRDEDTEPRRFVAPVERTKCDDPLVAMCGYWVGMLPSAKEINNTDAAIIASQYSSYVKLKSLAWMAAFAQDNQADQDLYSKAMGYLKRSIDLWPVALREEQNMPANVVLKQAQDQIETGKNLGLDRKDVFDLVDAALGKVLPVDSLVRLNLKGKFLVDYAWDARGDGWADRVTEAGAKAFSDRLAEAEKTLTHCYELFPDDPHAATEMLTVELGHGQGRQEMEQWFQRAMKADPDNYAACETKMNYLAAKWHGSLTDQIAFGRQCLATGRFECRIPLLVIDAHFNSAPPSPWASEIPWPYFARDDVWKDFSTAYDRYLEQHPEAWVRRGKYAYYAWMAGKRAESLKQFRLLENGPGSYRQSDMLRVVQIELTMHPPGQIAVDPTAQLNAAARKNTNDLKHIMVDAYDQVGSKNVRWDAFAHAALLAAAKDWGKDPDRDFSERDTVLQSAKQAIDAGCDDPLVRFIYSYTFDIHVSPDGPDRQQTSFDDGVAVLHSRYPAFIRLRAVTWGASGKIWNTTIPEEDRSAVFGALDNGMATLKQAVGDHAVGDQVFAPQVNEFLRCYMGMQLDAADPLLQRAEAELEAGHATPQVLTRIRTRYYHDYWDGIGLTKVLNRRDGPSLNGSPPVDLTNFESGWEKIWQEDPTDGYAALQLLKLSRFMTESQRPWLDFWAHEALRADPHSYEAGLEVLNQLQWTDATYEEIQSFCQEAVDAGDYRSQLPFLIVDQLDQYARQENNDPMAKPSAEIIGEPDNWWRIAAIYETYLSKFPLDSGRRSEYASYACLTGKWPLAAQQFKLLGDRVKPKAFYSNERLAGCLKRVKELTDSGYLRGSQGVAP